MMVWCSVELMNTIESLATEFVPFETGGMLLGYWTEDYTEYVITDMIGPGPRAVHHPRHFIPDHEYQQNELTIRYEESSRHLKYLGDWHSHPNGKSYLSWRDKRTLKRIALHEPARVKKPIMIVVSGPPWKAACWKCILKKTWYSSHKLVAQSQEVDLFNQV